SRVPRRARHDASRVAKLEPGARGEPRSCGRRHHRPPLLPPGAAIRERLGESRRGGRRKGILKGRLCKANGGRGRKLHVSAGKILRWLGVAGLAVLTACGSEPSQVGESDKLRIALIMKSLANEF